MKNITHFNESKESDSLSKDMLSSIEKIDDNMSYTDFALAVAKILKEQYGKHNYEKFMKVLHKEIDF